MKKCLLSSVYFFSGIFFIQAQTLYGTTSYGGDDRGGTINKFIPGTNNLAVVKSFESFPAYPDYTSFIQANDGKLYGVTAGGGKRDSGAIFSFDPLSSLYIKLKEFKGTAGGDLFGGLVEASDGKLYGVTDFGGTKSDGDIFSFDPSSSTYKSLYSFNGVSGVTPTGSLIQAGDGKLYGMTMKGGTGGSASGVIYSFDPAVSVYKKLKTFDNYAPDGYTPLGSLFQASDGKLYGTTSAGGSNGKGVIFSINPTSFAFTKLKDLDFTNGAYPASAFIEVPPNETTSPVVSLVTPANNATYLSGGNVYLKAAASDADGSINKVKFYNGAALLFTATDTPYSFKWEHVQKGNYTLKAKATDNDDLVSISDTIHISVAPNKPPTVSTITPSNGQIFIAPETGDTINIEASAQDADGRIVQVSFYNGSTLLTNSEHKAPYTYQWQNVLLGTYIITAVAKDNWSAKTTSSPITITVVPTGEPFVSSRPSLRDMKSVVSKFGLQLLPNPVENMVNINTTGLQSNRPATISVISASGAILTTKQLNNPIAIGSTENIQLNVSSPCKRSVYYKAC